MCARNSALYSLEATRQGTPLKETVHTKTHSLCLVLVVFVLLNMKEVILKNSLVMNFLQNIHQNKHILQVWTYLRIFIFRCTVPLRNSSSSHTLEKDTCFLRISSSLTPYSSVVQANPCFSPSWLHQVDLLAHRWRHPTVSIHGIEGAFSAPGTKTVIPAKVIAKFSIRQVPNMEPAVVQKQVKLSLMCRN